MNFFIKLFMFHQKGRNHRNGSAPFEKVNIENLMKKTKKQKASIKKTMKRNVSKTKAAPQGKSPRRAPASGKPQHQPELIYKSW